MTAGSGCPNERRIARNPRAAFPSRTAITIWNGNTRVTATSRPATSPRAPPRRCATEAARTDAIKRLGANTIRERYGNLFDMYEKITGENAYQTPMRIYPRSEE